MAAGRGVPAIVAVFPPQFGGRFPRVFSARRRVDGWYQFLPGYSSSGVRYPWRWNGSRSQHEGKRVGVILWNNAGMSRRLDPRARPALLDIAARLLADEGPSALSTRRLAAEAGSSTMAVYTHFGGMRGLVREMVHEGFARLQNYFTRVAQTGDPVADMALFGRAYRHNAVTNSHLYGVMFGGCSLGGFSLTEDDRRYGRYTLVGVVGCASRCMAAGRFRPGDAVLVAHQMWTAIHGLVTLELGDYMIDPCDAERCLEAQLIGLMVSAGDTLDAATRSVTLSQRRMSTEVVAAAGPDASPVSMTDNQPRSRSAAPAG
jgi:AcrR family transcriptional regulator